jgi:TRAP-type C4-dicarboxylate transport system permease small subunit
VRKDTHISLEFLYDRLGIRGKFVLDFFRHTLMLGLSVLMTIYAFPMIKTGLTNAMPATGISRAVLYAPALAGGVLMTMFSFLNILSLFAGKGRNRG